MCGYSNTFAYDYPGNLTTLRGVTFGSSVYNADNQLTLGLAYTYDGDGNPATYAGSTALSFDEEDRITTLPTGSGNGPGITHSMYRADGLRAYRTRTLGGGPVTTYFIYDGDRLLYELDNYGASNRATFAISNVCGWGAAGLAQSYETATHAYTSYVYDPSGNVVERAGQFHEDGTANDGTPNDIVVYDGYGALIADVSMLQGTARFGYPSETAYTVGYGGQWGYYADPATRQNSGDSGFLLCTHRWYDPINARWLTRDPIGYDGGIGLYGYADGNPIMLADPSGFDALILWGRNLLANAGKDQDYFKKIAEGNADAYNLKQTGQAFWAQVDDLYGFKPRRVEKAYVIRAFTFKEINDALHDHPNIDMIEYYGHGGSGALYLSNKNLHPEDVARLFTGNVLPNAYIELGGCDTNGVVPPGKITIAQAFANHFKTKVLGYNGGTSFGLPFYGVRLWSWRPRTIGGTGSQPTYAYPK